MEENRLAKNGLAIFSALLRAQKNEKINTWLIMYKYADDYRFFFFTFFMTVEKTRRSVAIGEK